VNACSSACGWCGACTDNLTDTPPARDYLFCDECGRDVFRPVSLAGVGVCCSRECMDQLEAKYAQRMEARRLHA